MHLFCLSINIINMAFTSYGNRVYASIKDLPQYTSINNGDKIIVWNESREGAATIDYSDFIIDLEHTSFGTTINELLTFTTTVESFISTVAVDIENLDNKINAVDEINKKLIGRLETLEYMLGIVYGIKTGDTNDAVAIKNKFINDDNKGYYNDLIQKIQSSISAAPSAANLISQPKFAYNAAPVGAAAATAAASISTADIVESYKSVTPTVVTQTYDEKGNIEVQKSSISYEPLPEVAMYTLSYNTGNGDKRPTSTADGQGTLTISTSIGNNSTVTVTLLYYNETYCKINGYTNLGVFNIAGGTIWKSLTVN